MTTDTYCDWCGEEITTDEEMVRVVEGRRNEMGSTLATFHYREETGRVCYIEARDYGWG